MKLNICIIGGGSREWTPLLMKDLAINEDLSGELRLYDIDHNAALSNELIGNKLFAGQKVISKFEVKAYEQLKPALNGVDFVIFSIEPGLIEKRYIDLVLPEKYGILQTVGDTTGPGGIFRAVRSVPIFREYATMIMKYCPQAWVINYTNPMTLCSMALYEEEPKIKAVGCCHEVFGTQQFLAGKVKQWFKVGQPARQDIKLDITGINHFTFACSAHWNDHDLYPHLLKMIAEKSSFSNRTKTALKRIREENWFESDNLIALEFLRQFNVLGASGDRHLAEFVPWFLADETELHKYGVIRTPYKWRVKKDKMKKNYKPKEKDFEIKHSDEEGVAIMKALKGVGPLYTNANVPNQGQIPWLPFGHIVESNAFFSRDKITPAVTQAPPAGVQSIIRRIVEVQKMTLDAIFNSNDDLLFQAFLNDPLVNLPVAKAKELFKAMMKKTTG